MRMKLFSHFANECLAFEVNTMELCGLVIYVMRSSYVGKENVYLTSKREDLFKSESSMSSG